MSIPPEARKIRNGEDEPKVTGEYGFYDSEHPEKIWWYGFGLPFLTAESAKHTGDKNVFGQTIIVRRPKGSEDWHRVESEEIVARRTSDDQIESIENEAELDPEPWVVRSSYNGEMRTSSDKPILGYRHLFQPREGYEQDREHYEEVNDGRG